jgi:PST family polysaccharide transporter
MKHMALLNVAARVLITISIFIFIRRAEDYIYVPLVQSGGILLMGAGALVLAVRTFGVRFVVPSVSELRHQLAAGWHLFLSRVATTLYTTSNTVILGLLTTDTFVGYYAAGDKIVRAIQGLQLPLSQAIFPHIGRLASESKAAALDFTERVAKLVGAVTFVLSLGLFFGAPYMCPLILGPGFEASVPVVQILSFLPFIIGLSNIFGIQIMVNFGMKKTLAKILGVAGIFNVILALVLVLPLRHIGVSIAVVLTETLVTATMYVALHRKGLNVLHRRASKGPRHDV